MAPDTPPTTGKHGTFDSTQWSLVRPAAGSDPNTASAALADLCCQYWYPIYAYVRPKVGAADLAEDLTQSFFAHLLEAGALTSVEPGHGKFRAYLLACCNHFLSNEHARANALKRGGGRSIIPLNPEDADHQFRLEPADQYTAERLFDRRWPLALLEAPLRDVEEAYRGAGNSDLFARLKPTLTASGDVPKYAEVAVAVGMTQGAVKKAAQRLRQQYGEKLRRRIAATVDGPDQVDDE